MRTKVRTIVLFLSYFLLQLIALSNIQARRSASVLASEDPNSSLPLKSLNSLGKIYTEYSCTIFNNIYPNSATVYAG
jgi:hypothetical protein